MILIDFTKSPAISSITYFVEYNPFLGTRRLTGMQFINTLYFWLPLLNFRLLEKHYTLLFFSKSTEIVSVLWGI